MSFKVNLNTMDITMHRGDTGAFFVGATKASETAWTSDDRMLFTIKDAQGVTVLQRFYRLDDQWEVGDGIVLIEFHNSDTDTWEPGQYSMELRFDIDPIWNGTAPVGRCVDALTAGVRMVEGSTVRTVIHSTLTIDNIYGEI